jgi:putative flavoprotein involved in K+ transport
MLAGTETIATIVDRWLAQFESTLGEPDDALLKTLFRSDSHWRDVLALTWQIRTVNGLDSILRELKAHIGRAHPTGFRTDPHRTAPRYVTRAGTNAIEAIFRFETVDGRGTGVLRLTTDANDGNTLKAWTLLTALDEIKGFEEQVGRSRPKGKSYSHNFRGPNWLDLRKSAAEYVERIRCAGRWRGSGRAFDRRTPDSIASRYADRGREQRIGDNWRNRYHALTRITRCTSTTFRTCLFPELATHSQRENWPAGSRAYVEGMGSTTGRPPVEGGCTTKEMSDGPSCYVGGRHKRGCVRDTSMATGVNGIPNLPDIPTLQNFRRRFCTPANTTTARHGRARTSCHRHRQQRP